MNNDSKRIFANNVNRLLDKSGLDRYQLSDEIDVKYTTLSKWLSGDTFPRSDALDKIADFFGLTSDQLLKSDSDSSGKSVRINVYGSIPAGVPLEAVQMIEDWEEIPYEDTLGGKEFFALKIKGDSMYPEYLEGDTVICLLQPTFESGQDCVVIVNSYDATLKRCYHTDKGIQLRPLNQAYPPVTYGEGDEDVYILGVVKEIRRKK